MSDWSNSDLIKANETAITKRNNTSCARSTLVASIALDTQLFVQKVTKSAYRHVIYGVLQT
jgi:hypothetical protein